MKIWIGEEQEGELSGETTLFIGDPKVTFKEIEDIIENKYTDVRQIYFGAGRCTPINFKVVKQCVKYFVCLTHTIEIKLADLKKISKKQLEKLNVVVTINNKDFLLFRKLDAYDTQIKLQSIDTDDKLLLIGNMDSFDAVDLSSLEYKKYKKDVVIK